MKINDLQQGSPVQFHKRAFSSDLVTFENSVVTPTLVAPSTDNTDYEVMKVAFPVNARFGRIGVIETP